MIAIVLLNVNVTHSSITRNVHQQSACERACLALPCCRWCCLSSSLLPLVGATSSLLPDFVPLAFGWCCSLPSFLLWCCFPLSPLGGVVLSPPPSGWCCSCPFLLWEGVLFGGACSSSFFWVLVLYRPFSGGHVFPSLSGWCCYSRFPLLGGAAFLPSRFWWFPTRRSTFHQTFML